MHAGFLFVGGSGCLLWTVLHLLGEFSAAGLIVVLMKVTIILYGGYEKYWICS